MKDIKQIWSNYTVTIAKKIWSNYSISLAIRWIE